MQKDGEIAEAPHDLFSFHSKCKESIGKPQFGFKAGSGTWDAIFCMITWEMLRYAKRCLHLLIDYKKAFDSIYYKPLMELLRDDSIGEEDLRIIKWQWQQRYVYPNSNP